MNFFLSWHDICWDNNFENDDCKIFLFSYQSQKSSSWRMKQHYHHKEIHNHKNFSNMNSQIAFLITDFDNMDVHSCETRYWLNRIIKNQLVLGCTHTHNKNASFQFCNGCFDISYSLFLTNQDYKCMQTWKLKSINPKFTVQLDCTW